jgi:tetratricopeptide (TPR) repeat protein
MNRARKLAALTLGLLLFATGEPGQSVGPPPVRGQLSPEQQARLQKLGVSARRAVFAGEMGRALRLGQEIESLRRRWQGPDHWETIDARWEVSRWRRLAGLGEAARKGAGRAARLGAEALQARKKGQHAEAGKICQQALEICREAPGEDDPETAHSYNNLAVCLEAQGKAALALPLHRKALAIRKKAPGEDHPDTAQSYSNLAAILYDSQPARALPLLARALAIRRKALGEGHPDTATGYANLGACLFALGQSGRALPLYEEALAIRRKVLGEGHLDTAASWGHIAGCLQDQGKSAQAQPLYEKALAIRRKALPERHPLIATSYNSVARCLVARGMYAQALPLHEKALAIRLAIFGEGHRETAAGYNSLASCLDDLGQLARALALFEKALAGWIRSVGEEHPATAVSYNNLAACLLKQGKRAQALPLYLKALAIRRKVLGEGHPDTATGYNNLGHCLDELGKYAQALPFFEKALAVWKRTSGEGHYFTAICYTNLAFCLKSLGQPARGMRLCENALAIFRKALGEDHPLTARGYNNLAIFLQDLGQPAQALPIYRKALAFRQRALGEEHPDTAKCHVNLASCLAALGRHDEAIRHWQAALPGHDVARLQHADAGFDRALAGADSRTPRQSLALAHARRGRAERAWQYAEADLARNLLDDLAGAASSDARLLAELSRLDARLVPLFGQAGLDERQKRLRDELARQRRDTLARLSKQAAARSAGLVWSLPRVQKQLPADAAVVLWVSGQFENWGCVLRASGAPRWRRLEGSGPKGAWRDFDYDQPSRLHALLADPRTAAERRRELTGAVCKRWFAPLEGDLKAHGELTAVKRLFVVSPRSLGGLPVEVLAPGYAMSYIPSATVQAKALAGHRSLKASPALALGDPVFRAPALPAPPKHGFVVLMVHPGSPADRAGLRAGDVLVRYDGAALHGVSDLAAALKKSGQGQATYWRDGKETTVALTMPPGIRLDRRPAPEAVKAFRESNDSAARGEKFAPLPGTRAEVLALQRLLGKDCLTLLGSDASERKLESLRDKLRSYRVLHFATHGEVNRASPKRSRLILARDKLPGVGENAERAARGLRPYSGELRAEDILAWELDADLVVLSACQTGLGAQSSGEGLLGFGYALMRAGARSVVLSRWKVDDAATALLMVRFYENLLGKAKGLKAPMGRADALAEAKRWLRQLPRKDAETLAAALQANKLSGTRGAVVELDVKDRPKLPEGERPYEHPFFWAAFVLIGDPD